MSIHVRYMSSSANGSVSYTHLAVHASILTLKGMDKPVIAAVQGAVAGFGMRCV